MSKELVISATPHETRVAILEDGQLCEIYIEREKEFALVGSIYKGRVTRVLPGMQSAFVDIGLDSDAFLYVGDFLENLEDYDHVVTPVEGKVEKMEQQGGAVFAPPAPAETPGRRIRRAGGFPSRRAFPRAPKPTVPETGRMPGVESPRRSRIQRDAASAIRPAARSMRTTRPAASRATDNRVAAPTVSAKAKDATGAMIAAATAVGDAAAGAGAVASGGERPPSRPRSATFQICFATAVHAHAPYEPPHRGVAGRLRANHFARRVAGEVQGPRSVGAPSRPGRDSLPT